MTDHIEADMRRVGRLFATCLRAVQTMQPANRVCPPHWREGFDSAKHVAEGRISLLMAETLKQMELVAKEKPCQSQQPPQQDPQHQQQPPPPEKP
jgi:alkyl hydroperoxide reductase subunit AhpC